MGKPSSSSASCCGSIIILSVYYICICSFSNFTSVEGFDSLLRLPHSGPSTNLSLSKTKTVFYVNDYGAKGDGIHDDTKAFKDVWKLACSQPGKAKIVTQAAKTYLVRPITFGGPCKAKLKFRMSGTIIAPNDPSAWDGLNPQRWLYFHKVDHLTVDGSGKIDGMGQEWWAQSCKINTTNACRRAPTAMTFNKCKDLNVKKITMVNSQQTHLAFTQCVQVEVSNVIVQAPGSSPNTDGIHISSSTLVDIRESTIGTGDDCISIVGNSSVIQITNITCGPGHGISIGSLGKSNSSASVNDISVDGAILSNTENGLRIKTCQGGFGFASNIAFQNVWMEKVSNPIVIDQYYCDSAVECLNQTWAIKVQNISFVGIKGTSATDEAIRFACSDRFPCEMLYLEDIQLISYNGGLTNSFCWEAQGSFSGLVFPHPCFSYGESYLGRKVLPGSVLQSI
ncbi:probable polygalacturonase At1g80170 [Actinidia eriantha]|uniref:probable polygalacturonase At1g80170 n=1 Tax=Actinidia eriantha TaxID=165200 RepID=UPI00258A2FA6|nr:probable polygalacturonase At1g80170 [Actinidia eriantha]